MITLTLPYPISANRYWASRVAKVGGKPMSMTYVTAEAKSYKAEVALACRRAGIMKPLMGRVAVEVDLYPHRPLDWQKRMRTHGQAWDDTVQCIDLDNANKVLLDAIKGIAIDDDKWVRRITAARMEPDGLARVVVRITQMALQVAQADLLDAEA